MHMHPITAQRWGVGPVGLLLLLGLAALPFPGTAQAPSCTVSECTLRLDASNVLWRFVSTFDPTRVVRGVPEIERYPFAPTDYFGRAFASNDSSELHYERFGVAVHQSHTLHSVSNWLLIAGFIGYLVLDERTWPTAVVATGVGVRIVGEVRAGDARREFTMAADSYNATLTAP